MREHTPPEVFARFFAFAIENEDNKRVKKIIAVQILNAIIIVFRKHIILIEPFALEIATSKNGNISFTQRLPISRTKH
jgi:hypothetical protein